MSEEFMGANRLLTKGKNEEEVTMINIEKCEKLAMDYAERYNLKDAQVSKSGIRGDGSAFVNMYHDFDGFSQFLFNKGSDGVMHMSVEGDCCDMLATEGGGDGDHNDKNAPYEVLFVTKEFKQEIDAAASSMGIDPSKGKADYDEFIEKALRCGMRHEEVKSKWLKSSPIEPPRDALDNVLNLAARVNKATSQRLPKDAPRSLEDNGDGTMSLLWSSGTGRGFDRCTTFQLMGEGEFAPLKITEDPLPETHSEKLVREAAAREAAAREVEEVDRIIEDSDMIDIKSTNGGIPGMKPSTRQSSAFDMVGRHHISPHNRPATRPAPAAELLGLCGLNTKVKDLEEKFDGIANSLAFVLKFSHQLSMVPNLQDRIIQEGNEVARIDERQIGLENRIRDKIRVLDSIAEELEKINAEIDDLSTRARTQASVNLSNSDSNSRLWSIVDILCQRLDNIESTLHLCT